MSVGTSTDTEQAPSPAAAPAKGLQDDSVATGTENPTSTTENENARPDAEATPKSEHEDSAPTQSSSSLLASLWSPISSLLQGSKPVPVSTGSSEVSNETSSTTTQETNLNKDTNSKDTNSKDSKSTSPSTNTNPNKRPSPKEPSPQSQSQSPEPEPEPEAYYTPKDVPLFKALQKKRLSGTRTKQLLRAASRAYNDPPPPPELGTCCGSSCDPCVNDLWREERDVWRERWGDRRVEGESDGGSGSGGRKELEW
ncbi:uncharacterized protein N7496_010434 [Penicillium cataractarum]|uniref:Oxidoreductase-like domain-containing protein n=1 Tax=Penicillium cataractarum TaxID=2100454 RepID=A0A9W9V3D3_9EURO|nr:uncharacterized protein N7496_010434 [Penicillium cataractarum]KAJ5364721.1 hypothetical protein N7496_010434 [Penicillium cataractarum]